MAHGSKAGVAHVSSTLQRTCGVAEVVDDFGAGAEVVVGVAWAPMVGCILRRGFCVKVRRMFGTTRSFARESLKAAGRVAVGRWTGTGHEVPLSWLHPCPWGFVGAGAPQPRSWRDAVPQYMLIGGPVELTRVLFVAIVRTDESVSIAWDRSSTARPQAKSQ